MSVSFPLYPVSKIEAARVQLEDAIYLFFSENNPISIYALASNALSLIGDLGNHDLRTLGVYDVIKDMDRESAKRFIDYIKKPNNFFKHADRLGDKDDELMFSESAPEEIIFFACLGYMQLDNVTLRMSAYVWWFAYKHKNLFNLEKQAIFHQNEIAKCVLSQSDINSKRSMLRVMNQMNCDSIKNVD